MEKTVYFFQFKITKGKLWYDVGRETYQFTVLESAIECLEHDFSESSTSIYRIVKEQKLLKNYNELTSLNT
jgi:hypothetical protein